MKLDWSIVVCACISLTGTMHGQNLTLDTTCWQFGGPGLCVVEDTLNERIIIGGDFRRVVPPRPVPFGVEVDTDMGLPSTGLPKVDGVVRCALPDGNGGWFLGGDFLQVDGQSRQHLAHILPNGSLAPWNPVVNGRVFTMAVKGDTLYTGGVFTVVNSAPRSNLAAVHISTGANVIWSAASANDTVRCMSLNSGRLYVGGDFTQMNGAIRSRGASFTLSNHALTTWSPNTNGQVHCIVATATSVYTGGSFTLVNGLTARNRLAAFPPTTNTPQAWNPNANGVVRAMALSGTSLFIGGDFTTVAGAARNHIALINAAGTLNSWTKDLDGGVQCMTIANNTVFVGGVFTMVDGIVRERLAAFGVPGSGVPGTTDWTAAVEDTVLTIASLGQSVFVGGSFLEGGGLSRRNIAALDFATGQPLSWAPEVDGQVPTIALGTNGVVYIGGSFTSVSGAARLNLAAIDPLTADALPWNAQGDSGRVTNLLARGDTLILCGAFAQMGGQPRQHLAAISTITATAYPWDVPLAATDLPYDLLWSDDTLFICGRITTVGGQVRNAVASIKVSTATVLPLTADCTPGSTAAQPAKLGNRLYFGSSSGTWGGVPTILEGRALNATTGADLPWPYMDYQSIVVSGGKIYCGGSGISVRDATTGSYVTYLQLPYSYKAGIMVASNGDVLAVGGDPPGGGPRGFVRAHVTPSQDLRVILDGPFNAGIMENQLRQDGVIPLSEPFTAMGYTHTGGGGGEIAPANIFTSSYEGSATSQVVDWVLVEYRDPVDPSVVVGSVSGLVLMNGRIMASNWGTLPAFAPDPTGSYYVAVRHRNHLGVMTAQPVDLSTSPTIDFSAIATPVYGNNARKTNSGMGTLRSGDVNFDGQLKYAGGSNDRDPILVRIGGTVPTAAASGYFNEDVNMDGLVKYTGTKNDRDPILVNIGGTVPTNVRVHQLP